jgi:hypothetical protein
MAPAQPLARSARDKITASRQLRRLGTQPGWPNLQFAGPDRRMVFLELKRRGSGRQSAAQTAMRDHLVRSGFAYLCTASVDEAIAFLKERSILRGRFDVQCGSIGRLSGMECQ